MKSEAGKAKKYPEKGKPDSEKAKSGADKDKTDTEKAKCEAEVMLSQSSFMPNKQSVTLRKLNQRVYSAS